MDLHVFLMDPHLLGQLSISTTESPEETLSRLEEAMLNGELSVDQAIDYINDLNTQDTYLMNSNVLSHTINQSLNDVIENLETVAKIAAYRSIAHSAMGQCIGAIRRHLRDQRNEERQDPADAGNELDQRNEVDELARGRDDIAAAMGFDVNEPAINQASLFHAVYEEACVNLQTAGATKWDSAMSIDPMLAFMLNRSRPLEKSFAEELAKIVKCSVEDIMKFHELNERDEHARLKADIPEIAEIFKSFGDNGYDEALNNLPLLTQHQLGIKLVEGFAKAKDNVLRSAMRMRRLSELGSIALLDEGISQTKAWIDAFENRFSTEILEAIEAGRNLRTLDDIKKVA